MVIFITNLSFFILVLLESLSLGKNLNKFKKINKDNDNIFNNQAPRYLENDNYIVIYFTNDCNYSSGFINDYRTDIDFIIQGDNKTKYEKQDQLYIQKDSGIEIHFGKAINSLNSFFNSNEDENMKYLVSVDFSNFNSININDLAKIFFGCSSLKSINFNNFKTSKVTNMSFMFNGCSSLDSLDLSSLDTSKVIDMEFMFEGCNYLVSIDLSHFDMLNCFSYKNMFSNINNIEYINLYNLKNDKTISCAFKNKNNPFFVCQKDKIIDNLKAYNCCDYNHKTYNCISTITDIPSNVNTKINNISSLNTDKINLSIEMIRNTSIESSNSISSRTLIAILCITHIVFVSIIIIICCKCGCCKCVNCDCCPCIKCGCPCKKNYSPSQPISVSQIPYSFNNSGVIFRPELNLPNNNQNVVASHSFNNPVIIPNITGIQNNNDNQNIIEHEPENDKDNPILAIFEKSGFLIKILIDSKKTIDDLIRFYFTTIKKSDLYGDKSIYFLINGRNIGPPYLKEPIEILKNKIVNSETFKIVVIDNDDKI